MIHAYNEIYLPEVMRTLAAVIDLAINAEGINADEFGKIFSDSCVAASIEHAVPDYLSGKSAPEILSILLGREVNRCAVSEYRTSEYWAGWVLAKTQWYLNRSFSEIIKAVPLSQLIVMYYSYHEANEMKTVELISERFPPVEPALKKLRKLRRLTQEQLSILSGVNIHSIRVYEQSEDGIMKAEGETLLNLSRTLECSIEDLLG